MKTKSDTIEFGNSFALPLTEFAPQGNALLGIRDSGKSYTATWLAERLQDTGIPFVAFDPIGIRRFLKVPGSPGDRGYNVVVAGEGADLQLSPASAPAIVRAGTITRFPGYGAWSLSKEAAFLSSLKMAASMSSATAKKPYRLEPHWHNIGWDNSPKRNAPF